MARNNNNVMNNNRRYNNARNNRSNSSNGGFSMGGTEWIVIILFLLALVGVYFYMQQNKHKKEGFSNHVAELNPTDNKLKCVLFKAEWCGHCQNFKPTWEKLKNEMNGTMINGVPIELVTVDCDEKENLAKAYNVTGFPTIKCLTKDSTIEYNDARDETSVKAFLRTQANELNKK